MLDKMTGFVLADRNYWKPILQEQLVANNLHLLAPHKSVKREKIPYPLLLKHKWYLIETVFG